MFILFFLFLGYLYINCAIQTNICMMSFKPTNLYRQDQLSQESGSEFFRQKPVKQNIKGRSSVTRSKNHRQVQLKLEKSLQEEKKSNQMRDYSEIGNLIEVYHDNSLLSIELGQKIIAFKIIIQQQNSNVRKFEKTISNTENNLNGLCSMISKNELKDIFKNNKNYQFNQKEREIVVSWQLVAFGFQKNVSWRVQLDEVAIQLVDSLKFQVHMLKSKLRAIQSNSSNNMNLSNEKVEQKNSLKVNTMQNQPKPIQVQSQTSFTTHQKLTRNQKQSQNKNLKELLNQKRKQKNQRELQDKFLEENEKSIISLEKLKRKRIRKDKKTDIKRFCSIPAQQHNNPKQPSISKRGIRKCRQNQTKTIKQQNESPLISSKNQQIQHNKLQRDKQIQSINLESEDQIQEKKESNKSDILCDYSRTVIGNKFKIDFANGDYYFGEMMGSRYHGEGEYFSYQNGDKFQGFWKDGIVYGPGKRVDIDGTISEGFFVGGKRQGKGSDLYLNGEKYEGQFSEDFKEGFGIYYYIDGTCYKGQWKQDKCHGQGVQIYPDGSFYEGTWTNDEKNNFGVLTKDNQTYKQYYNNGILISTISFKQPKEAQNNKEREVIQVDDK